MCFSSFVSSTSLYICPGLVTGRGSGNLSYCGKNSNFTFSLRIDSLVLGSMHFLKFIGEFIKELVGVPGGVAGKEFTDELLHFASPAIFDSARHLWKVVNVEFGSILVN